MKLIRDKVPELVRATGRELDVRTAGEEEFDLLLRRKLVEEVDEFLGSGEPEELADVLEVVHALAARAGLSTQELEALRQAKAAERGGFVSRLVWDEQWPA